MPVEQCVLIWVYCSGSARNFPTQGLGSPTGGYANFFMVKRIKVAN
jgi:hypothetical protein